MGGTVSPSVSYCVLLPEHNLLRGLRNDGRATGREHGDAAGSGVAEFQSGVDNENFPERILGLLLEIEVIGIVSTKLLREQFPGDVLRLPFAAYRERLVR